MEVGRSKDVFFRAMLAPEGSARSETGFFFLTLKYLKWMDKQGGYEKYREMRTFYLKTYAQALLMKHPHVHQIIGIAMEPPRQGRGASEDIIYAAQTEWSDADREQNRDDCAGLGIMREMKPIYYRGKEFPEIQLVDRKRYSGNRKLRRARAAREKRRK
jgi:hypothetical protein